MIIIQMDENCIMRRLSDLSYMAQVTNLRQYIGLAISEL
jgi:hypothetical protein